MGIHAGARVARCWAPVRALWGLVFARGLRPDSHRQAVGPTDCRVPGAGLGRRTQSAPAQICIYLNPATLKVSLICIDRKCIDR